MQHGKAGGTVPARSRFRKDVADRAGSSHATDPDATREHDMEIHRKGSASWGGSLKDGRGSLGTESGALSNYPYDFGSRFERVFGTNPEELICAAHAGCFTMALSKLLGDAGLTAERIDTAADMTLEQVGDGFRITRIHLTLEAQVPGANEAEFQDIAAKAKADCPVSAVLNAEISLDAKLH